jgi:hypothetical protein
VSDTGTVSDTFPVPPAHDGAVADPQHVHVSDVADRVDGALDADEERAELGLRRRRELVEVGGAAACAG